MGQLGAEDLAVVIPTRDRSSELERTIDALLHQTAQPGEIVVVVDGLDQTPPPLAGVRVLQKAHGGPGAARNAGARATDRPLILFLGDDMVATPELIARHVERHRRDPDPRVAVLGRADWHPDVRTNRVLRWMDRTGTQFDFPTDDTPAGFGHFYSCNVSLKRSFFLDAGGFDEAFTFYYEDLDCGWRLGQRGMTLLYAPDARVLHLHSYDLAALERRFAGIARGEWMMATTHDWFRPYFEDRVRDADARPRVRPIWPRVVDHIPWRTPWALRQRAEWWTSDWYHQRVAPAYLAAWEGERDLAELRAYLGDSFDIELLRGHAAAVEQEECEAESEEAFYRTSLMYLYDLTVFAMSGTKQPYLAALRGVVPPGSRLLDWGAGIGTDGLRLLEKGYDVAFAEFDNPSSRYLRWRLEQRGLEAQVYDLDTDSIPGGWDAAYSLDVIEHVDDPFGFLDQLERRASVVMVNFLEPEPDDTHLHKPLPIGALLDHAQRHDLLHYRQYHGRSHLVIYRTAVPTTGRRLRSRAERAYGAMHARLGFTP